MHPVISDLFDAPESATAAERVSQWIRSEPLAISKCATAISQSGRVPAPACTAAVAGDVQIIERVAPVAVREEMSTMLVGHHVHLALQWLHDVGAQARLLPELEATVDFSQESGRKHK